MEIEDKIVQFVDACFLRNNVFLNSFLDMLEVNKNSIIKNYQAALHSLEMPFDLDFLGYELLRDAHIQELDASELSLLMKVAIKMYQQRKKDEPNLSPVWTGPIFEESPIVHKTSETVRHLFQTAQHEILIVGYTFSLDHIQVQTLFSDLILAAKGGCRIDIIFHQNDSNLSSIKNSWPKDISLPNLYYWNGDPEDKWASLHSKLILVDQAKLLLTSANFTLHGFQKNIETGVMIENHPIASLYWRQFRSLLNNQEMKKYL
ncbi:phospholipase D-like domain-containing protein [Priestia megaterium]|uniref:phospholipase D-like domain-containing protein n=1 Tax=Priestia megaterium TaxID=1404 RepID=UPI000BFDD761|nr:phospholipase D-like domain-containing protein [Priestia megaterium]PGQ79691.1 hypothetical protein COA18_27975 [Priestia megaterium]